MRAIIIPGWLSVSIVLLTLNSCSSTQPMIGKTMIGKTLCQSAIAHATQTWEVTYYISKTSGGWNTQRVQSFQSNTLTNQNGEKPIDAVSGPDDDGIWWAALPPRPTADDVDLSRQPGEHSDPPELQRSVNYQLRCNSGMLGTDAQTYRAAARRLRSGRTVQVSYFLNRVWNIED
jgi:hypothetical protein